DVSKTSKEVVFDSHNLSTLESCAINVELLGESGLTQRSGYNILPENLIGSMTIRDVNGTDRGFILRETSNFNVKPFILNTVSPEYPELAIAGTIHPDDSIIQLEVCKYGRTTHYTYAEIRSIDSTVNYNG
ncbi:11168_t:CDS:2, partial [Cetraspora pellucida]